MTPDSKPAAATILVVDDNEANRALARAALEDEGYRVVLATGGAMGIELFREHAPDAVVLDVRMPEIDGFAACEKIRALPEGADTPVLFLTALRDIDTFDRALRIGADDFLTKPIRPAELVVRVQTALKLRRLGAELREHYSLLKQQRDDMLRLQLQKERLMAFVVHDLKNPVNSMDLHAQLLLRDAQLSAKAASSATQIRAEARQLTRMILNLLDLSKADEGKLSPNMTKVHVSSLVNVVLGELEVSAAARRVRLESRISIDHVRADEDLLQRTLANLLENAIRHAPESSAVTVAASKMGTHIEFRVADAGPGIPPQLRESVFDPFVQVTGVPTGQTTRGGRGLGLAFVKLAVEAHGGRIWVEDGAPGAVFCARFPDV